MTPQQMAEAARKIAERWPDAVVYGNAVGNLKVDDDTRTGEYEFVAWVDSRGGDVHEVWTGDEL